MFYLVPNYINEPPILQNPMMSPRWLPGIVGWLIVLFSVLLILQGFLLDRRHEDDERQIEKGPTRRFVLMVAALLTYVALFEAMGGGIHRYPGNAHPVRGASRAYLVGLWLGLCLSYRSDTSLRQRDECTASTIADRFLMGC